MVLWNIVHQQQWNSYSAVSLKNTTIENMTIFTADWKSNRKCILFLAEYIYASLTVIGDGWVGFDEE